MYLGVCARRFTAPVALLLGLAMVVSMLLVVPERARAASPSAWVPWLMTSADQFRLAPPPSDASAKTADELNKLRRMQKRRGKDDLARIRHWNKGAATIPWTEVTLQMIVRHRPRPAAAARVLALVHNGFFDALIAAYDSKQAYDRSAPADLDPRLRPIGKTQGSSYPPPMTVLAGAAEVILTDLFPNENPETFKKMAKQAVRTRLWAGLNYPSDIKAGRKLGHQVGELFVDHGANDNHDATGHSHPRPDGDEYWEPTPPAFEEPIGGPVGLWKPWVIGDPNSIRIESGIPGPYAYGSSEFMAELEEVLDVAENLSDDEGNIATFWDDGLGSFTPPGHWNDIALELLAVDPKGTRQTARIFSYLNTAEMDAAIAYFDAKFFWWSIRPITVIHRLCDDGMTLCTKQELEANPSRATHPDWFPHLITPNFPSYPSGHSTFSGAAGAALTHFFPHAENLLNELANEAAMSRLYGGIHFRSDNDDGLILGRTVVDHVLARAIADGSGM